jgi:hypothetical protein
MYALRQGQIPSPPSFSPPLTPPLPFPFFCPQECLQPGLSSPQPPLLIHFLGLHYEHLALQREEDYWAWAHQTLGQRYPDTIPVLQYVHPRYSFYLT